MMAARVLVIVGVINPRLDLSVAPSIAILGAVLVVGALVLMRLGVDGKDEHQVLKIKNPFDLTMVLKFGAFLGTVTFAAKVLTDYAGALGAYAVAALSGIADTAAITLSMARGGADARTATIAIFIAVAVNTAAKTVIAWWVGGSAMGWPKAIVSATAIAAGAAGLLIFLSGEGVSSG
jgi:uncharacterized membrane protein (DUF4010 family)